MSRAIVATPTVTVTTNAQSAVPTPITGVTAAHNPVSHVYASTTLTATPDQPPS